MRLTKLIILFSLFLFRHTRAFCQEYSDRSLFIGTGIGFSTNPTSEGLGLIHGLGYQTGIWKERLRLVPQITWGAFDNYGDTHVPDVHFYSRSAKIDLNFDLLKIKAFSLFIGTGVTGNLTTGLVGPDGYRIPRRPLRFFRESHVALNGTLGFRFHTRNKRLAYELKLFEAATDPAFQEEFVEGALFKVQLIYNIKSADNDR